MKAIEVTLVVVLAAVPAALPATAACGVSHPLSSANGTDPANRSFIWSATVFEPFYFPTYAPLDYQRPVTSALGASFWISGMGTTYNNGNRDLFPGDLAYDENMPFSVYFGAELNTDWTFMGVDAPMCPMARASSW